MKVKLISYSESRESVDPIGLKSWKKLGMEAEVEEGDILATSVAVLKEYVKGMILDEGETSVRMEYNNGASMTGVVLQDPQITKIDSKEEQIQSHIKAIKSFTTKKSLLWYEPLVKNANNGELSLAYFKKMQEFI